MYYNDKEFIKSHMEDYLRSKGINTKKNFHCLSPSHNDEHPSMGFDRKRNRVHCFSCGASYDLIDLIGIDFGLHSDAEKFAKARELYSYTSCL